MKLDGKMHYLLYFEKLSGQDAKGGPTQDAKGGPTETIVLPFLKLSFILFMLGQAFAPLK